MDIRFCYSSTVSTLQIRRAPLTQGHESGLAVHARGHGVTGARVLGLTQQRVFVLRDDVRGA